MIFTILKQKETEIKEEAEEEENERLTPQFRAKNACECVHISVRSVFPTTECRSKPIKLTKRAASLGVSNNRPERSG